MNRCQPPNGRPNGRYHWLPSLVPEARAACGLFHLSRVCVCLPLPPSCQLSRQGPGASPLSGHSLYTPRRAS
jgi:hypothetical protein